MFLRQHHRSKDGKEHGYWSLVETVRTPDGPRQRTICYLGELNDSAQGRWQKTIEAFNEQGESTQLKLFPNDAELPDDPSVARVLVKKVRIERTRRFGDCYLGLELWKRLGLEEFFAQHLDQEIADVPWSRVAAVLAINRLCAPGSELAIERHWYPSTALDDLLHIAEGKINDTRLYRCLDRLLPLKTKLEQHLKQRFGELFQAEFDVLLYDLTSTYVEGAAEENPMMRRGYGIYTIPEISMVGPTEENLTQNRIPYEVGIARYSDLAKSMMLGDECGMLKLLFNRHDRKLLGVHAIGARATEIIHIGQAVLAHCGSVEYFRDAVFNYPTLAEAYKVAALDGLNKL